MLLITVAISGIVAYPGVGRQMRFKQPKLLIAEPDYLEPVALWVRTIEHRAGASTSCMTARITSRNPSGFENRMFLTAALAVLPSVRLGRRSFSEIRDLERCQPAMPALSANLQNSTV